MTKRTNARAPRDSGWINLEEPREVNYWTAVLSVSEARLRSAVRAAGDATSAVRQHLGGQQATANTDADDDARNALPLQIGTAEPVVALRHPAAGLNRLRRPVG